MDQPSLDQIGASLQAAHDAGDTDGAQKLADYYRQVQSSQSGQSKGIQEQPGDIVVRPTADQLEPPSFGEQLGRAAARTGKAVAEGAIGLGDLLATPIRAGLNAVLPADQQLGTGAQSIDYYAQKAAPNIDFAPQNAGERYGDAISRGIGGTLTGIGVGNIAAGAANPVVAGIGSTLAANPGTQLASAVTGSSAAQGAKDLGAGPVGQIAAGLVGGALPIAPSLAGSVAQSALVGGAAGRQRVAQNIADFVNAGTSPTVGQATQSPAIQTAESVLAKTPGAAGVMAGAANRQGEQVANRASELAQNLSPGADSGKAGQAIIQGVSGPGGFVENFKKSANALYNKLDQYVPAGKPIDVSNAQKALADINSGIAGAPQTSALLQNPKLKQIGDALSADAVNGQLPYDAVKRIRSAIGDQLNDFQLTSDVPRAQLKQVYAGLSNDMENAAKAAGPQAQKALSDANDFYKQGQQRIDLLQRVVDKNGGPEAVFNSAMAGTKEGNTTIGNVMSSLGPQEQKVVSAAVLNRLGKANPGQQTAEGDAFSLNTFLTNWNKLSDGAKQTLFGGYGKDFAQNMDSIAKVASNVRQGSQYLANPSGTSGAAAHIGALSAFLGTLFSGHPAGAAAIAGAAGTANLGARLLTNPTFVKFLATKANTPTAVLGPTITALRVTAKEKNDPDLKAAADMMQAQQNAQ
jgi:hypothetical protein